MPSRIGRYAVRRRIGSGGFATVWLAYDEQLDSPVAVKVLAENWTEDHHVRQRFLEEGRFLRKVESPHVVTVYDAGELDDGRPYLVMSYADQGTLADRLEIGGLTTGQALEVVRQTGLGLAALHDRGVLHRDVKPANVLFRTDEGRPGSPVRAMVADLGLGKALDMSSRLTIIGGTPSFVAPEQARGERLDPRADEYALAAVAHLLLSGRPPYAHASLAAAAEPGPPPPLSSAERSFPDRVDAVVRRGLAPDREDRWPDVAAFVAALSDALGEDSAGAVLPRRPAADPDLTQPGPRPEPRPAAGPLPDPPTPPGSARGRRRVLGMAAVLALLVGGVAGHLLRTASAATVAVADETGALSVRVPEAWAAVRRGQWTPPGQEQPFASVSAGTGDDWASDATGEGVFVGVVPADDLPEQLPGHAGCEAVLDPVSDVVGQDPLLTQVSVGCPGVIAERVRQVATDRYLWIQVRSLDRATAYAVLEGVTAPGF